MSIPRAEWGRATRVVSLHDPDARPIAKGRLGKPVEFGYKAQVMDNGQGVVIDHTVMVGNPPDGLQLVPAIARVAERLGRPPRAAMVVTARLAACSADARALIQAASVLGQRCSVGLAARAAALDQPATALEEANAAGVLEIVEAPTGPAIAFSHPLMRAAVYHDIGAARRVELHARASSLTEGSTRLDHRIAATLVEDPGLAAEVAAHARQEVAKLRALCCRALPILSPPPG